MTTSSISFLERTLLYRIAFCNSSIVVFSTPTTKNKIKMKHKFYLENLIGKDEVKFIIENGMDALDNRRISKMIEKLYHEKEIDYNNYWSLINEIHVLKTRSNYPYKTKMID